MKYNISVTKTFSAAHALRGYKGRCERLHGHNWKIKVTISSGRLDRTGMVMDFTDLKLLLDRVLAKIDHRYLNEIAPFNKINPTAENIAAYLYKEAKPALKKGLKLETVEVWESETSSATAIG